MPQEAHKLFRNTHLDTCTTLFPHEKVGPSPSPWKIKAPLESWQIIVFLEITFEPLCRIS